MFDIPIALFIFKRGEKTTKIIERLAEIKPYRLYLIADGPRDSGEVAAVDDCRSQVEQAITWPCEVIKNYATTNRGVFENIAGGAKWVLEREPWAIFLEDDNMPELTFFPFCKEMLERYKYNERILWVCGTNYEIVSQFPDNSSYAFTQNMMPCGWASWSEKFLKYYDGDLQFWKQPDSKRIIYKRAYIHLLMKLNLYNWNFELVHYAKFIFFLSLGYQMTFTLRYHNLLGIVPKFNQITNIGVDENSIHGGTSFDNEMTRRFCGLPTQPLVFPLIHPQEITLYSAYEENVAKIITMPRKMRIRVQIADFFKKIFKVDPWDSLTQTLKKRLLKKV